MKSRFYESIAWGWGRHRTLGVDLLEGFHYFASSSSPFYLTAGPLMAGFLRLSVHLRRSSFIGLAHMVWRYCLGRAWLDHIWVEQTFVVMGVFLAYGWWHFVRIPVSQTLFSSFFLTPLRITVRFAFLLHGIMGAGQDTVLTSCLGFASIYLDCFLCFVSTAPSPSYFQHIQASTHVAL